MCTVAKLRQKSIKGYTECKRAHAWLRELYGAVFVVPPFHRAAFLHFSYSSPPSFHSGRLVLKNEELRKEKERMRRKWTDAKERCSKENKIHSSNKVNI